MGSGITRLHNLSQDNPYILERFREEYVDIFLKEYSKIQQENERNNKNYNQKQIKDILLSKLKEKEVDIIDTIVKEEVNESKSNNFELSDLEMRFSLQQSESYSHNHNQNQNHSYNSNMFVKKSQYVFLCCVDGSKGSDIAFDNLLQLRNKNDIIELFHAYQLSKIEDNDNDNDSNSNNNMISEDYLPKNIQSYYESLLINHKISPTYYSFLFVERFNKTPFHILSDLLQPSSIHLQENQNNDNNDNNLIQPDFIVLGYNGRKYSHHHNHNYNHNHENNTDNIYQTQTILGSTADMILRSIHYPCIICKKVPSSTKLSKSYLMAINFSENSKYGLNILFPLLTSQDILYLVYFAKPDVDSHSLSLLSTYYHHQLELYGPLNSKFIIIHIQRDSKLSDCMIDYCNGDYMNNYNYNEEEKKNNTHNDESKEEVNKLSFPPDYFAIASRDKLNIKYPLTDEIIEKINCNLILCKH